MVSWGDTKALAEAILELLNDPQKAFEIGRAGRRQVEKSFAWDVILPQWEKLFERIWIELSEQRQHAGKRVMDECQGT